MLIHPWDAAQEASEWREWLAGTDRFGMLAVNNLDPGQAPILVPTHFTMAGDDELLIHLARPNPVWSHLEAATEVRLAVIGDYAYIPTYWRARAGGPDEDGVPTSYYATVQFVCRPTIVDDPAGKVEILTAQLRDMQPEGGHATVAVDDAPYGPMLRGIRGVRLAVLRVDAKFEYDDTTRSTTGDASSAISRSVAKRSTKVPHRSSGGGWTRSATGTRRGIDRDGQACDSHLRPAAVEPGGGRNAVGAAQCRVSMDLITEVGAGGTAWLRLTAGALIFLALARPSLRAMRRHDVPVLLGLGLASELKEVMFLAAIERIPLGTAVAIEFLGPLTVAAVRRHDERALVWPVLALLGVLLLTGPWQGEIDPVGVGFAAGAGIGSDAYIVLTQRVGGRFAGFRDSR